MCEHTQVLEAVFVITSIALFIGFVVGINWWGYRDNQKMLDKMYPR